MLRHGYKRGLAKKLQNWIVEDGPESKKAARKIKVLSSTILALAPIGVGLYSWHLNSLIKEITNKIAYLDSLTKSRRIEVVDAAPTDEVDIAEGEYITIDEIDEQINEDEILLKELETEIEILEIKCE